MNFKLVFRIAIIIIIALLVDFFLFRNKNVKKSQSFQTQYIEELPKYHKAADVLITNMDSIFVLDSMLNNYSSNAAELSKHYFVENINPYFNEEEEYALKRLWSDQLMSEESYFYYGIKMNKDSTVLFGVDTFGPSELILEVVEHQLVYHPNENVIDSLIEKGDENWVNHKKIDKNTLYIITGLPWSD